MIARPAARAPGWAVIGVLAVTGVLAALQSTILLPLITQLPAIYDVGTAQASWIVTSTMLAGALATPIVSRLADMYGRRRLLLIALLALIAGSLLLATTHHYVVALAGRTLQGVTASVLPVAMSLLKDILPEERVASGVALVSATLGIGSAVGLPLAGFMFGRFGFSSLFWFIAGFAGLLVLAAWRLLPAATPGRTRERFDWAGAVLLCLGLTSLLLVVSQGNEWGWGSAAILLLAAGAVVSFALWTPWELRRRHPLVDLALTARRPVLLTNIASIIIALGMLANLILASLQFGSPTVSDAGFGLSVGATGLAMAAPAFVFAFSAPVLGALLRRFGGRTVLLFGAITMVIAYVARVLLDGSVVQVVAGSLLIGVGSTLCLGAMPMIIMPAVPPRHTASANGVNAVCRMVGTAASTAALAALTSATSIVSDGDEYPTLATIHIACWALAGTAVVASVLVWLVPRDYAYPSPDPLPAAGPAETASVLAAGRRESYPDAEQ
ncbi:MFS transporter [Phytohabitans kaempferiae]|uniref:MFS transporter n=1 Tax=Phytohabitans kaempferiae TaxID=1620943 RepID=A0ABV6M5X4_9ACTN